MVKEPKIVIIGAGAAGISAACRLTQCGLKNITILEAKDRIGGRVHTKKFADNVVELGAQWVHGEKDNAVFELVSPHNLLESSHLINNFEKHAFATSKGKLVPLLETVEVWKLYYTIGDQAANDLKHARGSYGEYFTKEFYRAFNKSRFTDDERAAEFLEWMEKLDNSIQCSDTWFEVSASGLGEYWNCEGDLLLNWKDRGYKTLFDLLMCSCPGGSKDIEDKIKLSSEVSRIDYANSDEIIVNTSAGEEFKATNVIFTASLGVLKEQHEQLFVPPLPEKKQLAIEGLNIGSVNKIFLEFPRRWWPEDSAGFGLIWSKEDKAEFFEHNKKEKHWVCDVFQFFTVDYQPRVLCGWITGESSRFIETLSDAEVKEELYKLLKRFLGQTYNISWPVNILRSKWYTDRHFRGCYSYRSISTERMNVSARDLAQPIIGKHNNPIVSFAGEATHDHYYSTVHGAVETGYREADRLANYYRQFKSHL